MSQKNHKSVLVVANYFPPSGGIAPQRAASFVRHLPKAGWEPSVVTVDWNRENTGAFDPSKLSKILNERVIHRAQIPNVRKGKRNKRSPFLRSELWTTDPIAAWSSVLSKFSKSKHAEGNQFFIRSSNSFLKEHLQENSYDLIWSSSPELSNHIVAASASKLSGIPWVADCRDDYAVFKEGDPAFVELEKKLLVSASSIVTVSKGLRDEIGLRLNRKIEVIENGFEGGVEAKQEVPRYLKQENFNMVYTGLMAPYYPHRNNPKMTFEAISLFLEEVPEAKDKFKLTFFGDNNIEPILEEGRKSYPNLRSILKSEGRIPREDALVIQRSADLLLILAHPGRKGILTGKVFEYLAARKKVFCLPGDGDELEALLKTTNSGSVFENPEKGAEFLKESFSQWKEKGVVNYAPVDAEIEKYSRESLAMRLGAVFDGILNNKV